ncbi:YncE family protein [Methylobacterium mesophilicum SR1.6/6]|uniref:YncE family protein n=1 Tax=Methylobacterium mesophilicum SR1.6/6 TaxID=908290 RepID=A0A6B9FDH2_9HYPH|nr:YncE family protein [Methylobacterium mesophilicum]QGY00629.1 YncE family protein [Methylobacterium mesophilicum SR1.6/6]
MSAARTAAGGPPGIGRGATLAALLATLSAFLGSAGAQELAVVSQQGARVSRIAAGALSAAVAVAPAPAVVAADAGGRLYVSHPDGHAITVVEPDGALRRLPFAGQAFGLAVEPDGRAIYVGDWSGNRVARLSAATGAVEAAVDVGRDPAGLVLGADGRLYVAERESRSVGIIDTGRMERVASLPVGDGPFALAHDPVRQRLYVANVRSNDVTVIDAAAARVLGRVTVGASPYGVAVSGDGARVLVTNQHAASVSVIDAAALSVVATVPVGRYPEGVALLGTRAYVANWFSDDVSVIDLDSQRAMGRIPVAEGPRTIVALPPAGTSAGPAAGAAAGTAAEGRSR